MALSFFKWSQTAASNATADPSVNWSEGQSPSSVNDSARAMMASAAGYRDDISGAITSGGTSTAYTVTSFQVFDSLSNLNGKMIAFTPHTTNGATVTLNVDGLGAKPLRSAPSTELPAGVLIQGTPYVALYNSSDAAFYLHGFFGQPYNIPIGGSLDYWGTAAPNSAFAFMFGQAISRTTYSTLFSLFSTTFGSGDGSTTFNIPDLRGRITPGRDDMGGSAASRLTNAGSGITGTTLGATGGAQNQTLSSGHIPSLTSSGSNSITVAGPNGHTIPGDATLISGNFGGGGVLNIPSAATNSSSWQFSGSNSISVSYTNSSQTAVTTAMPSIVCNKILRLI